MNKAEKDALLQFMRLTLYQLHPDFDEYPIEDMRKMESKNEIFVGTKYENNLNLVQAYFMKKALEKFEES